MAGLGVRPQTVRYAKSRHPCGTWRATADGAICFDPEGDEGEECFSGGAPGDDGTFELQGEDGTVQSSVRKVDPEEAGAETTTTQDTDNG